MNSFKNASLVTPSEDKLITPPQKKVLKAYGLNQGILGNFVSCLMSLMKPNVI